MFNRVVIVISDDNLMLYGVEARIPVRWRLVAKMAVNLTNDKNSHLRATMHVVHPEHSSM